MFIPTSSSLFKHEHDRLKTVTPSGVSKAAFKYLTRSGKRFYETTENIWKHMNLLYPKQVFDIFFFFLKTQQ